MNSYFILFDIFNQYLINKMNSITLFIKFEFLNIKHLYKCKCFVIFKKKLISK